MAASTCRVRPLSSVLCARTLPGLSAPLSLAAAPQRHVLPPSWPRLSHPPSQPTQPHPHLQPLSSSTCSWLCSCSRRHSLELALTVSGGAWTTPLALRGSRGAASVSLTAAASAAAAPSSPSPAAASTADSSAGSRPTSKRRRRQQQHSNQGPAHDDAVVFIGFHEEELDVVRQRLPELVPIAGHCGGDATSAADESAAHVVDVRNENMSYTVSELLERRRTGAAAAATGGGVESHGKVSGAGSCSSAVAAVSAGRVVLLVGPVARSLGAELNDHLAEWGVVPALIAAYQPKQHEGMPIRQLVAFLRDSHAAYYSLLQPVRVEALQRASEATAGASAEAAAGATAAVHSTAEPPSPSPSPSPSVAVDHLRVLEDVRVVLCAAMDGGEVPSIHGHYRRDAGHVVVLDGLLTEAERGRLLDWLTAPGHCHEGPPPEDKWEMVCVDREGARPTWGLQPQVLKALQDDPPPPVVALQTRLAALYPEYDICHMPAEQISESYGYGTEDDGSDTPLSPFVGNAVMAGDPCAWHADADPTTVPPHSPWVHNFGYYHNREFGRPLFVSMLLYLNETWPEDYHAETLFLDPETQLGLFVRPQPGRVVLLEQDLPHRISAPSLEASGPRYSLVWKLVLVPRPQLQPLAAAETAAPSVMTNASSAGTSATSSLVAEDHERVGWGAASGERGWGQGSGGCVAGGGEFQSICRPEWGEPVRIGSANKQCGVPAFRPR